ncbi:alkene reductase [Maribellus maritimus]|uniref:alkene reductase n=1 Tax=Maribellus maritimus TaxID=2870838 RepID=UPI001EE9CB85|nr:alkene reductase [Maribellus maritimus]MCG6190375.1 alkene reductase [Maribellus maritimus]
MENKLLTPLRLGDYALKNRVVMAPLTRMRADVELVPIDLNVEYYRQRSSAGLIITEASQISRLGQGYPMTPGIYSDKQVAGWQKITDAVHKEGSRIFLQLWHVGRISHSSFHTDEGLPVAPSAIQPKGNTLTSDWKQVPFETPRALETSEIKSTIQDYRHAANNAKIAGFDGVELHSANGYLLNQFLHGKTNHRKDEYGGSVENRARLTLEVIDQLVEVWGAGKVGIRLSPFTFSGDVHDLEALPVYGYLLKELNSRPLAYVHFVRARATEIEDQKIFEKEKELWNRYSGTIIAADGFTPETALEYLDNEWAEAIAFGRNFISNPDLPRRIEIGAELNPYDRTTFYGGGEKGYTDYPFLQKQNA